MNLDEVFVLMDPNQTPFRDPDPDGKSYEHTDNAKFSKKEQQKNPRNL